MNCIRLSFRLLACVAVSYGVIRFCFWYKPYSKSYELNDGRVVYYFKYNETTQVFDYPTTSIQALSKYLSTSTRSVSLIQNCFLVCEGRMYMNARLGGGDMTLNGPYVDLLTGHLHEGDREGPRIPICGPIFAEPRTLLVKDLGIPVFRK